LSIKFKKKTSLRIAAIIYKWRQKTFPQILVSCANPIQSSIELLNERRWPQIIFLMEDVLKYLWKWKTTSIILVTERRPQIFL
jgi:hypothetical protein